jgi:hypothetical protein
MSQNTAAHRIDIRAFFARAAAEGRAGTARKTKPVEARPARVGEIVVTIIPDEGVETRSKPAAAGDMVVRNCCRVHDGEYL